MAKHDYYDLVTIMRLHKVGLLECLDGFSPKDEVDHTTHIMSAGAQAILVGQASRTIEKILSDQGSKEDLIDAIKYGLCCIDAKKYGLDVTDAQIKFRYQELYSKYMNRKEAVNE